MLAFPCIGTMGSQQALASLGHGEYWALMPGEFGIGFAGEVAGVSIADRAIPAEHGRHTRTHQLDGERRGVAAILC